MVRERCPVIFRGLGHAQELAHVVLKLAIWEHRRPCGGHLRQSADDFVRIAVLKVARRQLWLHLGIEAVGLPQHVHHVLVERVGDAFQVGPEGLGKERGLVCA